MSDVVMLNYVYFYIVMETWMDFSSNDYYLTIIKIISVYIY